jgi:hypothetical protein
LGGDEMTVSGQPAPLVFSTGFGLLMVAAAAVNADRLGLACAGVAVLAMLIGIGYRSCATVSVVLVIVVIVVSDPPPLFSALAGLSAAGYLVIRHAAGAGIVTTTRPTVVAMVGFMLVGLACVVASFSLPWLPLLAPPAVVVLFALVMFPFLRTEKGQVWKI